MWLVSEFCSRILYHCICLGLLIRVEGDQNNASPPSCGMPTTMYTRVIQDQITSWPTLSVKLCGNYLSTPVHL